MRPTPPDFTRDVHCVFGLPFDALSEDQALACLTDAAAHGRRLFLSTPNLSFAAGCVGDPAFRQSVVNSDLSTPDGAPIIWLARLMGAPLAERVTGSNLFDRLAEEAQPPLSVYFFGGPDGTAERAAQELQACGKKGLKVVGWRSPGFVPLDAMSGPAVTEPINAANPQFVVVALGARKGQLWIERNWPALQAPIISHLGAVINFVAGTVARAPLWVQRSGMEWLWRIKEEPELWRRYWRDGWVFLRYVMGCALPWAVARLFKPTDAGAARLAVQRSQAPGADAGSWLISGCAVNGAALEPVRRLLTEACQQGIHLKLDLRGLTRADTGFIALIQLLDGWQRPRSGHGAVVATSAAVARDFARAGAAHLLNPGSLGGHAALTPVGSRGAG